MSCNTPLRLSVLIPVYGVEQYMEECARSLFSQTLREGIEFIFVDDATPDGSIACLKRVLAEFPERVEQVHILRHDRNRGLAAARRTAIEAARAPWLLHVDSDDVVMPDAAEVLLATATTHTEVDMVFGDYYISDNPTSNSGRTTICTPHKNRLTLLRMLIGQSHRIANRTWGVLIRHTLCTRNQIYPIEGINFAEDYAVMPRLLHAAREVVILRRTLYGYRMSRDGSYMKHLDDRAAAQYVAANRVVTDYLKQQTDYPLLRKSVILGRLNIKKWILKRGLRVEEYDARLFYDGDRPYRLLHRIYAAAIESGTPRLARIAGVAANLWA